MPTKIISGKTPQKIFLSSITTDASVNKRKLRNMILPSEVAEEEEEEEEESVVPFVMKTKIMDVRAQKVVEGDIHRGEKLIASTLLDQEKEQHVSSEAQVEEDAAIEDVLKTPGVRPAEAITGLKSAEGTSEVEASVVLEEGVSKLATNHASEVVVYKGQASLDSEETDITGNNLNSISKEFFYSSTLNHISPTPSPKLSP